MLDARVGVCVCMCACVHCMIDILFMLSIYLEAAARRLDLIELEYINNNRKIYNVDAINSPFAPQTIAEKKKINMKTQICTLGHIFLYSVQNKHNIKLELKCFEPKKATKKMV